MTEFGTTATVDVEISPSSLRQARTEIENLGDVSVGVSSSTGGSSVAGRDRARQRQLVNQTNDHLSGIGSSWEENLDLNSERNELLREIVDVTEQSAQTRFRGGGGVGGGMMGPLGLTLGAAGVATVLFSSISDRIGEAIGDVELNPGDVVESAAVTATDVIDSAAELEPVNVVTGVALSAADVVTDVTLEAADVVTDVALGAGDVVSSVALTAADVVTDVTLSASDVVTGVALGAADVIDDTVDLEVPDIVDGTITAAGIIEQLTEGTGDAVDDATGGGVGPEHVAGVGLAGAAGAAAWGSMRGAGGAIASRLGAGATGLATPVFTPSMFREDMEGLEGTIFDERHPLNPGSRSTDTFDAGRETRTDRAPMLEEQYRPGGEASVENQNRVEINADLGSLERDVRDGLSELERRVEEVERAFN